MRIRLALLLIPLLVTLGCSEGGSVGPGRTEGTGATATPEGAPGEYPQADQLIDATWLLDHLDDPSLRIVAFVSPARYAEGHIPGAVQLDWPDVSFTDSSPATIQRWREETARLLGERGIRRDHTVVAYDDGSLWASRLWWILHQFEHGEKYVLNGGVAAWQQAGGDLVTEPPEVLSASYDGTPRDDVLATLDEVRDRLGDPEVVIVDARTPDEYRAGHIPGAVNLNFPMNATGETLNVWRPADELREMYEAIGVTPGKTVIAYCDTGVRSAVTYFTLRLIGYPDVRLYSASWAEWGSHPDVPRESGG
jgi:thiosulfate/3-mercaptopyruvate sulfurtransferase